MPTLLDATGGGRLRVSVIIPAFNEEEVIGDTLGRIPPGLFDQVIVAVNGSTDRTAERARQEGATVVEIAERGYGAACLAAIPLVSGEVTAFLQADGSEDPSEIGLLVAPIARGEADLVIGSRTLGKAARGALLPHQVFGNWLATTLIRWRYGYRYTDLGPFRAIRTECLRRLPMTERTFGWTVEMQVLALEHGLRVAEVPVSSGLRRAGTPKVAGNLKASLKAGATILRTVLARGSASRPRGPLTARR
jgi:cellulose synthase/poly-beta-1,6-N-acetylglucosamine synthase-like glycosyltransferase